MHNMVCVPIHTFYLYISVKKTTKLQVNKIKTKYWFNFLMDLCDESFSNNTLKLL